LEYEKKSVDYFSIWLLEKPGQINLDFATAELESSINKTFICTAVDEFSTYNFFADAITKIHFSRSPNGKVEGLKSSNGFLFLKQPQ
jgi:hypothetical protein